jgi:hypothetical protein
MHPEEDWRDLAQDLEFDATQTRERGSGVGGQDRCGCRRSGPAWFSRIRSRSCASGEPPGGGLERCRHPCIASSGCRGGSDLACAWRWSDCRMVVRRPACGSHDLEPDCPSPGRSVGTTACPTVPLDSPRYHAVGQLAKLLSYTKARRDAGLRRPGPRRPDSNRHLFNGQLTALPIELLRGRGNRCSEWLLGLASRSSGHVRHGHGLSRPRVLNCASARQ